MQLSTAGGAAIGQGIAGFYGAEDWRIPFVAVALSACSLALCVALLVPDPPRDDETNAVDLGLDTELAETGETGGTGAGDEDGKSKESTEIEKLRAVLRVRTNMFLLLQALPGTIPWSVITTFLTDYLHTERGLTVPAATRVFMVAGVSCLCFAIFFGAVGQVVYNWKKSLVPILTAITLSFSPFPFIQLLITPAEELATPYGEPTGHAFVLAIMAGVAGGSAPNIKGILMSVNRSRSRGAVFSMLTVCDDVGKGLGPAAVALAANAFGRATAFTIGFACWWLAAIFVACSALTLDADSASESLAYEEVADGEIEMKHLS